MKSRVTLTYDSASGKDGTGAQLQRVFGIYSIAKLFKIGYLHTEIENLTITPLDPFQDEKALNSYLIRMNEKFALPSSIPRQTRFDRVHRISRLDLGHLIGFLLFSLITRKSILLQVQNPFPVIERSPKSYSNVRDYFSSHWIEAVPSFKEKKVVLHIRRGSNGADLLDGELAPRMLPNAYYFAILNDIRNKHCQEDVALDLIIITDVPRERFTYRPIEVQLPLWNAEPRFHNGSIEVWGESFEEFRLPGYREFEVIHGGDPIAAIDMMHKADFLVMSRSSFSYVGAILNSKGKVFYPPNFWHKPMPNWLRVV